jgi:hypothetical protein
MNITSIPSGFFTKRQREILSIMASTGEEMIYEQGIAYVGNHHTSGRTVLALLAVMAIKEAQGSRRDGYERYTLTSLGRDAVKNGGTA